MTDETNVEKSPDLIQCSCGKIMPVDPVKARCASCGRTYSVNSGKATWNEFEKPIKPKQKDEAQ